MTLITILVGLLIDKFFHSLPDLRRHEWFAGFQRWMQQRLGATRYWDGPAGVVLLIGPVLIGVGSLQYALRDELFGLLPFVFAVGVLLLTLAVRELDADLDAYLNARERQDDVGARRVAAAILGHDVDAVDAGLSRAVLGRLLVRANEQVFALLFWFVVLGPVGAVLVRLADSLRRSVPADGRQGGFGRATSRLMGTLTWLPARLTALGFAVTGSFEGATHGWRDRAEQWSEGWVESAASVVAAAGMGAIRPQGPSSDEVAPDREAEIADARALRGLLWRTLYFWWIALIAVLSLLGWAA